MDRTFVEQIHTTSAGLLLYAQAVRQRRRRRLARFLSGWSFAGLAATANR